MPGSLVGAIPPTPESARAGPIDPERITQFPPQRPAPGAGRAQPLGRFLHVEAAGGILLVVAAVVALIWANAWPAGYESLWSTEVRVEVGDYEFAEDLGTSSTTC